MGMYNPTNTRCQMMCYTDLGAPQAALGNRTQFLQLLDTLLTQGYNTQTVTSLTVQTDGSGVKTIKLTYAAAHGYRIGHLIEIQGATDAIFNNKWRVIATLSTEVTLRILDQAATYPTTTTGSLISKVSHLNWDIVYSSATQRSYRSKMENSSKNIISLRLPRHKGLVLTTSCMVHEVDISRNIKMDDGSSIDSYTSHTDFLNQTSNDNKPYGPFYVHQYSSAQNILATKPAGNTYRLPWYIIGDGRIFYFIHGPGITTVTSESDSYLNYIRDNNKYTYRYMLCFGDPNSFDENDVYNGGGSVFSCARHTQALTGWESGTSEPTFGGGSGNAVYFLKSYDGSYNLQSFATQSIGFSDSQNFNGTTSQNFPNLISGGFIYYPYYGVTNVGGNNLVRAEFPYLRFCPLLCNSAFSNTQMTDFDWNPKISADGSITVNIAYVNTSNNLNSSFAFNVGK